MADRDVGQREARANADTTTSERSAPGRVTATRSVDGGAESTLAGGRYPRSGIWPRGDGRITPASHLDPSVDSHDIVGNTLSATRDGTGALDARSQRRLYERLAELEGRDPVAAGEELEAMEPAARASALRTAVTAFQDSHAAEIAQIREDNAVEDYHRRTRGALSERDAPEATSTPGEARPNDATMQAVANAWPQTILGRSMNEAQAYTVLRRLVLGRGLPFNDASVNVIGMRGFQGEMHGNGEAEGRVFTAGNRYDDTVYLVSNQDGPRVQRARGTVDPGGGRDPAREPTRFQVAADQQWRYQADRRAHTEKFDRPMYGLRGGGVDPFDVSRGRYWRAHADVVDQAAARSAGPGATQPGGGRLYRRPDGSYGTDLQADGDQNTVSAFHSGNGGGGSGERVAGDSTGCTVIHGEWFAHFNEGLRRASGGDSTPQFTYSLIDLRSYTPGELTRILDTVVPAPDAEPARPQGHERRIVADFETIPDAAPPARTP